MLATADGCGTAEIMRRSGKTKPVVWTWQARFMTEGVDGLLRDKTRKPGKAPLQAETVQLVIDLVTAPPPGEATHWTGRMLAKAAGVSLRSVQRILEAHQLAPHRIRTFKLSNDPKFAAKLRDIVGLYINPPAHAVVLSVDEKRHVEAERLGGLEVDHQLELDRGLDGKLARFGAAQDANRCRTPREGIARGSLALPNAQFATHLLHVHGPAHWFGSSTDVRLGNSFRLGRSFPAPPKSATGRKH
jgi:hypothetical protein